MFRFYFICLSFLLAYFPASATTVVVRTGDGGNFFSPAYFTINPGDTVKWIWVAGAHNTSGASLPKGASVWYSNLNSTTTEFSYVPTVSGLYQYTCTHHSGMDASFFVTGCSFPDKPDITMSWKGDICSGSAKIVLKTKPQSGTTYQWINSGFTILGATNDSLLISTSGSYRVVANRCGADSISSVFSVPAYPLPVASFSYTSSSGHYSFTNTSARVSGYNFRWHFGDGSPEFSGVHAAHDYAISGSYVVTLIVSDSANHCMDSVTKLLPVELGLHEQAEQNSVVVFPNPSAGYIEISTPIPCMPLLRDIFGKIVYDPKRPAASHHQLKFDPLAAGCYLLELSLDNGEAIRKQVCIQ